jgi:NhaP-type Na+/H+ or K+/H+ antiporter
MHEHALVVLSAILLAGMGCQWIAWRVKLPAILFLLLCGILSGPVLNWLHPDQLFGDLLFPFISLAVAVILFEGSLTLKFEDISGLEKVIRNMITFGVAITWLITAIATRWLLRFSWEVSLLFGALMVVTGPTVIVPMLRTVRPKENVAHILRWEGILIDPIGATLAVLVYQFIISEAVQEGFFAGISVFGKIVTLGCLLGVAGGQLFGAALRRHWIPQYLHNFTALSLVCSVFALSDTLEAESGLLSVTVMGVWLANMKDVDIEEILDFKESLSVLLISMLFIMLAARMDLGAFLDIGWPALAVFGVIQFLSRPLNAQISAIGSKLSMAERHLLAWIAPRGIVAAAISALFAIRLESIGYAQASQMIPLTFMVIIGTVFLQSTTAGPIAKWLKVAEPEPKGFLIIGADRVSRAIAKALQENGFRTLLADQNWDDIKNAKLAAKHYRMEFGANNIYVIRTYRPKNQGAEDKSALKHEGRRLFSASATHQELSILLANGAEIKTTALTEKFSYEDYLHHHEAQRIPLFVIDNRAHIHPLSAELELSPKTDWKIISLAVDRSIEKK